MASDLVRSANAAVNHPKNMSVTLKIWAFPARERRMVTFTVSRSGNQRHQKRKSDWCNERKHQYPSGYRGVECTRVKSSSPMLCGTYAASDCCEEPAFVKSMLESLTHFNYNTSTRRGVSCLLPVVLGNNQPGDDRRMCIRDARYTGTRHMHSWKNSVDYAQSLSSRLLGQIQRYSHGTSDESDARQLIPAEQRAKMETTMRLKRTAAVDHLSDVLEV